MNFPNCLKKIHHKIVVIDGQPVLIDLNLIKFSLSDWPKDIIIELHSDLINDKEALSILSEMKIPENRQMEKFIFCKNGNWNTELNSSCEEIFSDHVPCNERGKCAGEGELCNSLKCKDGILYKRELEYCKYLASGKDHDQISELMKVDLNTISGYELSVKLKMGVKTSEEIKDFFRKRIV